MKIAQWGTFDVENFGDLLFPLIAAWRLRGLAGEFELVSPTSARAPVWPDCLPSLGFEEANGAGGGSVSGVLLGGGHVVSWDPTRLDRYAGTASRAAELTYPMIWLGAAAQADRLGVPFCWNAPGVKRKPEGAAERGLLRTCLNASSYVSVRDEFSRACLDELGSGAEIEIVPDTVLEISRLWPRAELEKVYRELLRSAGLGPAARTIAIHVNRHYAGGRAADAAAAVDKVAEETGLHPMLFVIGPVHGDDSFTDEVAAAMRTPKTLVTPDAGLKGMTSAIAFSEGYIGSSMHGMITALSYGLPGLMVVAEGDAKWNPKFTSLLDPLGLRDQMVAGWEEVPTDWRRPGNLARESWEAVLPKVTPALDRHWNRIGTILGDGSSVAAGNRSSRDLQMFWQAGLCLCGENELSGLLDAGAQSGRKMADKQLEGKLKAVKSKLADSENRVQEMESHWTHSIYRTTTRWRKSLRKRFPGGESGD